MNKRRPLLLKKTPWERFKRYIYELLAWTLVSTYALAYELINRIIDLFSFSKHSKREIVTGAIKAILITIAWIATKFIVMYFAEYALWISVAVFFLTVVIGNEIHRKGQAMFWQYAETILIGSFWRNVFLLIQLVRLSLS